MRIELRIDEIKILQGELSQRIEAIDEIPESQQSKYYSSWMFAACHMATTIPGMDSLSKIAKLLNLSEQVTQEVFAFLIECGLIINEAGQFRPGKARVYLKSASPLTTANHRNWRLKAMAALEAPEATRGLHFSGHFSLSAKDAARIRDDLIRTIEESRKIVRESPEEELHTLCIDFFKL